MRTTGGITLDTSSFSRARRIHPRGRRAPDWEEGSGLEPGGTGKRILLVEDDPDAQQIYQIGLEHAGFTVTIAADGEAAVQLGHEAPPSLMVMDIVMPRLDGWSAIATMRAAATMADVPILVVTGDVPRSSREQAIALGCQGFLQKPLSPSDLVCAVRELLGVA